MTEKLKTLPPAWARVHRLSAGKMILAEQAATKAMREAVTTVTAGVVFAGASNDKATILTSIRSGGTQLRQRLTQSVFDARRAARDLALQRLSVELALVEKQAELDTAIDRPAASDADEDPTHADIASSSYASAWSASLLTATMAWADQPTASALDVRGEVDKLDFRLARIAATETARAYNDEHDEGVGYVATTYKDTRWIAGLLKHWEGILDRRICEVCKAHDGEVVPVGMRFEGGDEPSFVHVLCRCQDALVFLPARMRTEVPGRYTGILDEDQAPDEVSA